VVNKVMIIGRLGRDPEVRFTQGGQAVCNFSVATTEYWKDKAGDKNEKTEWHKIVVWGKTAEFCGEYLKKGRQVYVEGKLQTREWEKDGEKKYTTEIVAQTVQAIGPRPDDRDAMDEGGDAHDRVVGGDDRDARARKIREDMKQKRQQREPAPESDSDIPF
jgi:single-strand DNA-binding protein